MMYGDNNDYAKIIRGRRNRAAGKLFEDVITAACHKYQSDGVALIIKTPEPMKPIRAVNQGQFLACYEKKAQPDYKGVLMGGRTVIFEAKHTEADRIEQKAVTDGQYVSFEKHTQFGAICFVLVSFGFQKFYKIPWEVFRDMKGRYGRKYIKPEDIPEYRIYYTGGMLKFLG